MGWGLAGGDFHVTESAANMFLMFLLWSLVMGNNIVDVPKRKYYICSGVTGWVWLKDVRNDLMAE